MTLIVFYSNFYNVSAKDADVKNSTEAEKLSTNIEARQIAHDIQDAFEQTTCDNPKDDVVKRACNLSDKTSKALILWRISEEFISKYYDDKIQQMQNQSAQTNRPVSQDTDKNENEMNETFWLDRGDMDGKKCQWDFDKRNACDYPDGFEEFSVSYHDSNLDLSDEETWIILNVWLDNPTETR